MAVEQPYRHISVAPLQPEQIHGLRVIADRKRSRTCQLSLSKFVPRPASENSQLRLSARLLPGFRPLRSPTLLGGGDDCPSARRRELPFRLRRFRRSLMLFEFGPLLSWGGGDPRHASLAYFLPLAPGRFGSGGG